MIEDNVRLCHPFKPYIVSITSEINIPAVKPVFSDHAPMGPFNYCELYPNSYHITIIRVYDCGYSQCIIIYVYVLYYY